MTSQQISSQEPQLTAEWFPELSRQRVYANHAAMSPWPAATRTAIESFARDNTDHPDRYYLRWLQTDRELRSISAQLMGANCAADITLTNNTTEGVCTVANGLDWKAGDSIVTAVGEFPTNRMAWENLSASGVRLVCVDLDEEDPEHALIEAIDDSTKLVTISSVQWITGLRLDLKRLGKACRERGVLFFVDAIQQLGALEIDVIACNIDFLAAGSHKWQMGPEGMGLFYSHQNSRQMLSTKRLGWNMLANPYDFDHPDQSLTLDGRRFEPGSTNQMGKAALHASLTILQNYGMPRVEQRVLENTRMLNEGIAAIPGLTLRSDARLERSSGIVHFSIDGLQDARVFAQELLKLGVVAVARAGGIRVSPHFYQGPEKIQQLLTRIEQAKKQIK